MNPTIFKGYIPDTKDLRDRNYTKLARASTPFDWSKGYDIEQELGLTIKAKDQGSSGSCGGQAGSYYMAILEKFAKGVYDEKSAKDIYSQIFQSGGGIVPRDLCNILIKKGVCQEVLLTSYDKGQPPEEYFMERKAQTPATVKDALISKPLNYGTVSINIDSLAQAIRDNHGIVITVGGQNNGTWQSEYPQPPIKEEWAHFLYAGKAKIIAGRKFIGVLNSWGDGCGDHGWQWIDARYIPHISTAWTLYDPARGDLQKISVLQKLLNWYYTQYLKVTGKVTKTLLG